MELLDLWPEFLRELREFAALAQAQQGEMDTAEQTVRAAPGDFFAATLSPAGAGRWEAMLGLPVRTQEDLEQRRFRILSKWAEQRPFTLVRLRQLLDTLCGQGGATAAAEGYKLTVKVALTAKASFDDVGELLERVVPLNLEISLSLLYNRHSLLAGYTHAQLADYTHEQLRSEVHSSGQ